LSHHKIRKVKIVNAGETNQNIDYLNQMFIIYFIFNVIVKFVFRARWWSSFPSRKTSKRKSGEASFTLWLVSERSLRLSPRFDECESANKESERVSGLATVQRAIHQNETMLRRWRQRSEHLQLRLGHRHYPLQLRVSEVTPCMVRNDCPVRRLKHQCWCISVGL